jgi:drug/metabolite transporter (DMT)-like permease
LAVSHPFKTLLVGVFQGVSIFLYFSAILQTSVSNALFLLYTAPIFSVLIAKFFLKERIERKTVLGVVLTLLGIIFVLDPRTFSFNSSQTLGNALALGAGFFYAAMALTAKPVVKEKPGFYAAFWQYLVVSVMFLFSFNAASVSTALENWWQLGLVGVLSTGIAFTLFMQGIRKVKGQKIFIVTALEPLSGSVLALIVLGEVPSLFTIIGAALIFYGVFQTTKSKALK